MNNNKKYGKTSVKVGIWAALIGGVTLLNIICIIVLQFKLGWLFYIVAVLLAIELCKKYETKCREQHIIEESKTDREPQANEWKCPECGKINALYVGSCGCGYQKKR